MATITKEEARGRLAVRADKLFRVLGELIKTDEALAAAEGDAQKAGLSQKEIDKIIARQRRKGQ